MPSTLGCKDCQGPGLLVVTLRQLALRFVQRGLGWFGKSGAGAVAGGMAAVGQKAARSAANAALSPLRKMAGQANAAMKDNFRTGVRAGLGILPEASGGTATASPADLVAVSPASTQPATDRPEWATAMKNRQSTAHGATVLAHTMKAGDSKGGGTGLDIKDKD